MSKPGIRQTRRWRNLALAMKAEACGRCSHCDKDVGIANLELGHVTSLVRGGPALPAPSGLQVLCRPCHRTKTRRAGDVAPASSGGYRGGPDRRFTRQPSRPRG